MTEKPLKNSVKLSKQENVLKNGENDIPLLGSRPLLSKLANLAINIFYFRATKHPPLTVHPRGTERTLANR